MTIANLAVITAGKMVELGPGDTLEVQVSFKYTADVAVNIELWASLGIGIGRDIEAFKPIHLDAASLVKTWTDSVEIPIPTSGKADGTYWMKVEVDGVEVTISNAVVVSGMPTVGFALLGDMIAMLVLVMMMSMIMSFIESPTGFVEKGVRVAEKVERVAAPVIKIFAGKGE